MEGNKTDVASGTHKKAKPNIAPYSSGHLKAKQELSKEDIGREIKSIRERREKALKENDTKALIALGKEIRESKAFPDYKRWAAMCFADAARLGSMEGMVLAGWCAEKGFGVKLGLPRYYGHG